MSKELAVKRLAQQAQQEWDRDWQFPHRVPTVGGMMAQTAMQHEDPIAALERIMARGQEPTSYVAGQLLAMLRLEE